MHRYARLTVVSRLCFSLAIMTLVPAVPRESLHPAHAPSTPTTARPVIRLPTDLSRKQLSSGFSGDNLKSRRVIEGFALAHLLDAYLPRIMSGTFDPTLITTALLPQQLGLV
jgi:hypothetical protein